MTLVDFIERVYDIKLNPFQKELVEKLETFPLGDIQMIPARNRSITLINGGGRSIVVPESVVLPYLIFLEMQQKSKGENNHE